MSEKVSVAVIGLGGYGRRCLEALLACDNVKVVGACDRDAIVAEQVGRDFGVESFSDTRQMILTRLVKCQPAAVFIATPPMHWGELLEFCAENNIHVWKAAPLARNLSEAVKYVRMFDNAGLKLCVANHRRFAASYVKAAEFKMKLGNIFLARGHYLFNWGGPLSWRGDMKSAGGGAMLEVGFHPVDLLVWMLGLPEEVYGVALKSQTPGVFGGEDSAKPHHDTDDTACATWRYKDDTMVTMSASRISGPAAEELAMHGQDGSVLADFENCSLRNVDGSVVDVARSQLSPLDVYKDMMTVFAADVLAGKSKYACSGAENLLNHAVIDATYLSSRTGQPESPLQQLQIQGMTPLQCLSHVSCEDDE